MTVSRGRFISLEGIDGAGKTTHMAYINGLLTAAGYEVVATREPGGTALGERLRQLMLHSDEETIGPDAETLMMFAARAQHLAETIKPALVAGQWVLCDRFTDATYAYQGGGRGLSRARISVLEQWVQGALRPDLTLLFDLSIDVALGRARKRAGFDRFERENKAFLESVRRIYLETAERESDRVLVVPASDSVEAVQLQLQSIIGEFIERAQASVE